MNANKAERATSTQAGEQGALDAAIEAWNGTRFYEPYTLRARLDRAIKAYNSALTRRQG